MSGAGPVVGDAVATAIGWLVGARVRDSPDRAAVEVHIEEVATGPFSRLTGFAAPATNVLDLPGRRPAVEALRHRPDAVPGIVGEEQAAVVFSWVAVGRLRIRTPGPPSRSCP